ncbi:threonine ammonia-lyase [Natribacillus halophilus]|uniref:threonine ammonia-lyase n=1 Tax=Natribacillus halophilus TaxID=549003 RepID=A0A1G8KU80_9BACI|nr:threonine/serine dehydratase [Natribacillus halophilus]SDI46470.1 threonine dehydratase [Natribacillus halophilus]
MMTMHAFNEARTRLQERTHVTPVLSSKTLNDEIGTQVFIKAEHLQKTGSFKIRGATNRVTLAKEAGATHLLAASSGNHGQAVAYIARTLGLPATIVVPEDANPAKLAAIRDYGSDIIPFGTTSKERIEHAKALEEKMNATIIPPYDDDDIIAGQGTVGLEILSQVRQPSTVVVPIGGGGLIAGVATAIKSINPAVKVVGVEPQEANGAFLSREAGERVSIKASTSVADGLRSSTPGQLTFPLIETYVDDVVLVSEDDIRDAFTFYLSRMKQVVEPSGAVSLAALRAGKIEHHPEDKVVLVASGGNLDLQSVQQYLSPNIG